MRGIFIFLFLAFSISMLFFYIPSSPALLLLKVILAAAFLAAVALIFGPKDALAPAAALVAITFLQTLTPYAIVFALHAGMASLALFFVEKELGQALFEKIAWMKPLLFSGLSGIGLFLAMAVILVVSMLALMWLGIRPDTGKVYERVIDFPFYLVLFAVLVAPITEELFYRAFIAGRFGVLISAILFSFSHMAYGSYYELFGAFIIGIVLGIYYVKKRNLAACMIAHALFNMMSLGMMLLSRSVQL